MRRSTLRSRCCRPECGKLSANMTKIVSVICFLVVLTASAAAQQVPDFSCAYVFKSSTISDSRKSPLLNSPPPRVVVGRVITKVVQDSDSVEISYQSFGHRVTCKYILDGSETQHAEQDGTPTTVRAEIKGGNLIIRTSIKVAKGALKGVPILRTETWELSKDLATLTVHQKTEIQEGRMPMVNDLQTVTYLRQ